MNNQINTISRLHALEISNSAVVTVVTIACCTPLSGPLFYLTLFTISLYKILL